MPVDWIPHRFAGGALALDVANTVVLRIDPQRTFDRFADPAEIPRFAAAASRHRADEIGGVELPDPGLSHAGILTLREATDRLLRAWAEGDEAGYLRLLPGFLRACADALEAAREESFEARLALSALSLIEPERRARVRICANCGWLFLDRSRNGSRLWCDMAVCGNRAKARRHYRRRKVAQKEAAREEGQDA